MSVSLSADERTMLDEWIAKHPDPKPSREEAVRRLMTCGLIEHPGQ